MAFVLAHIDEEHSVEYGKRITLKMSNGAYHDPWTPRKSLGAKNRGAHEVSEV